MALMHGGLAATMTFLTGSTMAAFQSWQLTSLSQGQMPHAFSIWGDRVVDLETAVCPRDGISFKPGLCLPNRIRRPQPAIEALGKVLSGNGRFSCASKYIASITRAALVSITECRTHNFS